MQTNLYSATRGCKLYFLFLTNMNMVFALKIHHFSRKTFPLAICLWDVEFCLADGQCRRVTRLCGKEWVPGTWGILFSSDNLWKFYSFNMVKCKCGKEIIYIYIFFQTVERKGKTSANERVDRTEVGTAGDRNLVSSHFPACILDLIRLSGLRAVTQSYFFSCSPCISVSLLWM